MRDAPDEPSAAEPGGADEVWARLRRLPSIDDAPLPADWGVQRGTDADLLASARRRAPLPPPPPGPPPAAGAGGGQWFVPADEAPSPAGPGRVAVAPVAPPPPTAPPAGPAVGTPGPPPPRRRRRRPGAGRIVGWVAATLALGVVAFVVFAVVQYLRIERVDLAGALSAPGGGGTNVLIVGSDSRDGFDPNDPNAGAVLGDGSTEAGERADTMVVLRLADDGTARMMSIPRDLWVTRADGSTGRINAALRGGPDQLVRTVRGALGLPVHRYVEVDFVTFAGMVDAVGGVTVEIPHPARDDASGLYLPEAGPVELDGVSALAFVRSRRYTELIDGQWRTDPTGDLGRAQRQQQFLRAVMGEVGSTRNPVALARIGSAAGSGLRIDDRAGLGDLLGLGRRVRGLDPETVILPVRGANRGGAAVLDLVQPDASAALALMGASG